MTRSSHLLGALLLALVGATASCRGPSTEIVLVVDTDLSVPTDVDRVTISITGSDMQPVPFDVDLTAAGAPQFPLTLGLAPAGAPGPVSVSVVGFLRSSPVLQQEASTDFVEGSQRMLRLLLLGSCIGDACPAGNACGPAGCVSVSVAGDTLPPWTGSVPARPTPDATKPIGGRTVWANGWHSCANEGETLYCWGQNYDGEIGDGSQMNAKQRRPVFQMPAVVGLGQHVSCACDQQGQAWCWGRNFEGEIGLGSVSPPSVPVPTKVPGVTDCVQITGGAYHTCVVHADATVSCWGGNDSGQVGQPPASAPAMMTPEGSMPVVTSPKLVPGLANVADVEAGEKTTCARLKDMTVVCWGDNVMGQLGDGTRTNRSSPAPVAGVGNDVVELAAGRIFMCARHASGAVSCWGANGSGELGNGTASDSSVPVDAMVTDAIELAAGFQHACALRSSGVVSCWGRNDVGQLGNGTTVNSPAPVDVIANQKATSIAAGSVHTCARYVTGLACWGQNVVNQLGDDTSVDRWQPVTVAGF